MDSLPGTDVFLGSIVSLGAGNNQQRDIIQGDPAPQAQGLLPRTLDRCRAGRLGALSQDQLARDGVRHGLPAKRVAGIRLLVDPNDFLAPQVFNPSDRRWFDEDKRYRVPAQCR